MGYLPYQLVQNFLDQLYWERIFIIPVICENALYKHLWHGKHPHQNVLYKEIFACCSTKTAGNSKF